MIAPATRPRASRSIILEAAIRSWNKTEPFPSLFVFGVRGYYRDTMGKSGYNDRGIYDDAIFIVGPESFAAFNANTDPSAHRSGVASLIPGWHPYRPGNHGISKPGGGYPAFRPATPGEALPVKRDGESQIPSARPGVAINIHKGGYTTTSSLGCQTIHPAQWAAFQSLLTLELKRAGLTRFWYGLIEGPIL